MNPSASREIELQLTKTRSFNRKGDSYEALFLGDNSCCRYCGEVGRIRDTGSEKIDLYGRTSRAITAGTGTIITDVCWGSRSLAIVFLARTSVRCHRHLGGRIPKGMHEVARTTVSRCHCLLRIQCELRLNHGASPGEGFDATAGRWS